MSVWPRLVAAIAVSWFALQPAAAADRLIPIEVALGDVSLNKVPFLIAADAGIYTRNGLAVRQFLTPAAAAAASNSGVVVPRQYVRGDVASAPIGIGGGTPMVYRVSTDAACLPFTVSRFSRRKVQSATRSSRPKTWCASKI